MDKFCVKCGKELKTGDTFCTNCGTPVGGSGKPVENGATGKTNGQAIAGFICSIIGFWFAGIILGAISISLSSVALKHLKAFPNEKGKGLAIAGLIIGIVDVVGAIAALVVGPLIFK